jgi:hypothetical protein
MNLDRNLNSYHLTECRKLVSGIWNMAISILNCGCQQQRDNWYAEGPEGSVVQLVSCIHHAWSGLPKLSTRDWSKLPPPSPIRVPQTTNFNKTEQCWPIKTYLFARRRNYGNVYTLINSVVCSNKSGMKYLFTPFQKLLINRALLCQ